MLEVRKAALIQSVQNLKEMIVVVERTDPDLVRQKMFGGDKEKEKIYLEKLKKHKEYFMRTKFNITKRNEKLILNNKVQKLIVLIRRATNSSKIDELVANIDSQLLNKMDKIQSTLEFVRRDANPELQKKLQAIYQEFKVQDKISVTKR